MAAAPKESNVDVLIIGAGPAGVMAANWMSRFSHLGITTRIIDKRNTKVFTGQADGLQCRTLETLKSFGLADQILAATDLRWTWVGCRNPDPETGRLTRTGRIPDTVPGISRYQQVVLNQGRIERYMLDSIKVHSKGKIAVERSMLPERLEIDESKIDDLDAYPVTVEVRQLSEEESTPKMVTPDGKQSDGLYRSNLVKDEEDDVKFNPNAPVGSREIIHAKYVIGCDGAHSWTRRQLGFKMVGESTDYIWGVIDGVPKSNFPDIRSRCAIHSANAGSVMIIPRERGIVRFYIQLELKVDAGGYVDRTQITPALLLESANKSMAPYTLEVPEIDWFTGYQIGQRVTDNFSKFDRVFIAGDACHTHSPKAGQGMNTSMMDTYNLTWKIGQVLAGLAKRDILSTYSAERQPFAQALIDFDHKFSRLFSGKPASKNDLDEMGKFKKAFVDGNKFASGTAIDYASSLIIGKQGAIASKQELAKNLPVGMRTFSVQVINQSDAKTVQLLDTTPSNGAWRLFIFPGDVEKKETMARLHKLAAYLDSDEGIITKYTPKTRGRNDVIDTVTVHTAKRTSVELFDFPQPTVLPPYNYWKVFADDESYHKGHDHAYEKYGIDPAVGAVVVIRPDFYTALVVGLEDTATLDAFFAGCLVPAKEHHPASALQIVRPPVWDNVPSKPVESKPNGAEVAL